jgi:hypothetical protein
MGEGLRRLNPTRGTGCFTIIGNLYGVSIYLGLPAVLETMSLYCNPGFPIPFQHSVYKPVTPRCALSMTTSSPPMHSLTKSTSSHSHSEQSLKSVYQLARPFSASQGQRRHWFQRERLVLQLQQLHLPNHGRFLPLYDIYSRKYSTLPFRKAQGEIIRVLRFDGSEKLANLYVSFQKDSTAVNTLEFEDGQTWHGGRRDSTGGHRWRCTNSLSNEVEAVWRPDSGNRKYVLPTRPIASRPNALKIGPFRSPFELRDANLSFMPVKGIIKLKCSASYHFTVARHHRYPHKTLRKASSGKAQKPLARHTVSFPQSRIPTPSQMPSVILHCEASTKGRISLQDSRTSNWPNSS